MTDEELGEVRGEFKPGMENLIAGIIIGVLMIIGGAVVTIGIIAAAIDPANVPAWVTEKSATGGTWSKLGFIAAAGGACFFGGFYLIHRVRFLSSFRVWVGENGLAVNEKKSLRLIDWDDIVSVKETRTPERGMPSKKSKSFVVKVHKGEPIRFDANAIKGHTKLAEMIRQETEKRDIPWKIVEVVRM